VLQCVACVAVCCSVLQCVAVCCSVLQFEHVSMMDRDNLLFWAAVDVRVSVCRWHTLSCCSVLQCVAVCCSVLQCVAVCCTVLQCVAVCAIRMCV